MAVDEQLDLGAEVSAADYLDAQRARVALAAELLTVFDECDVLAMPTVPVVAPPAEDFASYLMVLARNAIPWSRSASRSVPCGFSEACLSASSWWPPRVGRTCSLLSAARWSDRRRGAAGRGGTLLHPVERPAHHPGYGAPGAS